MLPNSLVRLLKSLFMNHTISRYCSYHDTIQSSMRNDLFIQARHVLVAYAWYLVGRQTPLDKRELFALMGFGSFKLSTSGTHDVA